MSKRQVQKMLRLMAGGGPVELTSPMASVKKLAELAFTAQQFGYEYLDVRQSSGRNGALVMLIAPDPSPHARARAAQNWAQYPNAHDGVSVPALVPDAFELLKARINFDLTGKNAEKRTLYAAVGGTIGAAILGVRLGADAEAWVAALFAWVCFMAIVGIAFLVNRRRNVKFAARLQAAGFTPVTDDSGRVRYLPPGAWTPGQFPGQGDPFAAGPYGSRPPAGAPAPDAPAGYGRQAPGPYPVPPAAPGAYPVPPVAPAAYPVPAPGAYGDQPAPGPYGGHRPQSPYAAPQQPYGLRPQPPHPQQNPHWQPPQR